MIQKKKTQAYYREKNIYNQNMDLINKEIKIQLFLDDPIDNCIYYLICAKHKKEEGNSIAHDTRIDAAKDKLITYIRSLS